MKVKTKNLTVNQVNALPQEKRVKPKNRLGFLERSLEFYLTVI